MIRGHSKRALELEAVRAQLSEVIGCPLTMQISTGDYRLGHELLTAPPPSHGEIVIATPERFDAILRNPDHDRWIYSIDAVCVDEAHLISSPRRGATLEYVLTSLLCLPAPPRLMLLSATLGNVHRACEWLAPCDVISVTQRYPLLQKEIIELHPNDNVNKVVVDWVKMALMDPEASVLIFVYQTRSAEHLAALLRDTLGTLAGSAEPLAYHSQMSVTRRETTRTAFCSGQSRCIVATTALGLGVNLPATHVLVRDNTFVGVGPLSVAELLQMMGRAGRGESPGHAAVLVRSGDAWTTNELAEGLRNERLPELVSTFEWSTGRPRRRAKIPDHDTMSVATHVAARLSRCPDSGVSAEELRMFFEHSLGGKSLAAQVQLALSWLTEPAQALAFRDEHGLYHLTVLGLKATRAVIPLSLASSFARLVRDLLAIDPSDQYLRSWHPLDHLTVLHLLSDHRPSLRPFSAALVEQIDAWMETSPNRTLMLYRHWLAGQQGASRAHEVLGSLGLSLTAGGGDLDEWARKQAYLAVLGSIVLYERGQVANIDDLERRWGIKNLEGVEERWRDDCLWLLSGLTQVLDLRCFYFHLREECAADSDRLRRVKQFLGCMRAQVFDLQEHLKYCSSLGPVLRGIRRMRFNATGGTVGFQTIRRLEEGGICSIAELVNLTTEDLVRLGIRRDLAKQIRSYLRCRLQ